MMSTKQIEARKFLLEAVSFKYESYVFTFFLRDEGEQALERRSREGHAAFTICEAASKALQQLASS